jgi:hypothetical protein
MGFHPARTPVRLPVADYGSLSRYGCGIFHALEFRANIP